MQVGTKCRVATLPDHSSQSYASWVAPSPVKRRQTWLSAARLDCHVGPSVRFGTGSQPGEAPDLPGCCDGQINSWWPLHQRPPRLKWAGAPLDPVRLQLQVASGSTREALENSSSWAHVCLQTNMWEDEGAAVSTRELAVTQLGRRDHHRNGSNFLNSFELFQMPVLVPHVLSQLVVSVPALQAQYLRRDFKLPVWYKWGWSSTLGLAVSMGLEPTSKFRAKSQCIFPWMINVAATELTNNRNNNTSSVLIVCNKYMSLQADQPWLCHVSEDSGWGALCRKHGSKARDKLWPWEGVPHTLGWAHEVSVLAASPSPNSSGGSRAGVRSCWCSPEIRVCPFSSGNHPDSPAPAEITRQAT